MKTTTWALVFLTFPVIASSAQQANSQEQNDHQSKRAGATEAQPSKARRAAVPACKDLETTAIAVDKLFDKEADPILAAIKGAKPSGGVTEWDAQGNPIPSLRAPSLSATSEQGNLEGNIAQDSTWDNLIDCANQTHSASERAEALRVAAMWERWRAEQFQKAHREQRPVHPASCDNLNQLMDRVKTVTNEEPWSGTVSPMPGYEATLEALKNCMNDSVSVSKSKPDERYWSAVTFLSLELWESRREKAFFEHAYTSTSDYARAQAEYDAKQGESAKQTANGWREALADPSSFVVLGPEDRLSESDLSHVSAHNRNLCDQVVTVAGLTPNGLALYIPPDGQRFMAKNAKNYPRMCLLQDATSFVPGVSRYLLVWAYSEAAFAGFQPVQQVTTAPVLGSGTVTNLYGERWNFTFTGTLTEIDAVEAPYVLQSRSLYLWAYDAKGNVVSRHSITTSSQAGGDASYAAGYNAVSLISALWNNPSHLIKGVLNDVQKASGH